MTDDDLDWEEWMAMSDAQQDAFLNRQREEYTRRLRSMTIPQQVAHHRHFVLQLIKDNRRRLRDPNLNTIEIINNLWRDGIRRGQIRLVKLRIWRETGVYPGKA